MDKLRELIPRNIWNHIAQDARGARTYRELLTLIMNQLTDPKTGMLLGEKTPAINGLGQEEEVAYAVGKGGFGGKCWNCGDETDVY